MRAENDMRCSGEPGKPGHGAGRAPAHEPAPARPPLDAARLNQALLRPGGLWPGIEVTESTGSTNADLLARAAQGAPEGLVLTAEEQVAGRGRLGRSWVSPPRSALMFSLLLRPHQVPGARRGWLPLLAGVAVAEAVNAATGAGVRLKWPNDLLAPDPASAGDAKLAGILAEASGSAIVVGVGLNVSTTPAELPPSRPRALPPPPLHAALASQALPAPDREALLAAILASFERWYQAWRQAAGDPEASGLRPAYTRPVATIGPPVRGGVPRGPP